MSGRAWLDGALTGTPLLPADDPAVLTGEGVFETLLVRDGTPVAPTRHGRRLLASAALLGLAPPSLPDVDAGTAAVLADAAPDATALGRLRVTWTGGGHLLVTLSPMPPWPATATVVTAPWPAPTGPLVGAKTTSYAAGAVARRYARQQGADEALLLTADGRLAEGATTSVLVETGGRLLTPPLSAGILPGVTRGLLLHWGLVDEADLAADAPATADGTALLSATRGVHPVGRLDGRVLPQGRLVAAAREEFARRLREDPDPA